jgi:hypothetical protein
MYTDAPGVVADPTGTVRATQSATNGLQFSLAATGTRPAGDYTWSATGTPTFTPGNTGATTSVAFAAAGSKTITLTVAGAGTPPPANNTYNVTVNAVSGAPKAEEADAEAGTQSTQSTASVEEPAAVEQASEPTPNVEEYDPGDFTVAQVIADVEAESDPEFTAGVIEAEQAGKDRRTLLSHLEDLYTQQTTS